ncbi:glycosyltransferase family 2 protein [Leptospira noguchii]|uniref:Glycosyltransferase, group 2 family protein n=1 Tax=Leptospira noguchii serovar Panama str. CZ214 TaxID=1001595 RepID=T0FK23_9LEPT|nr:glycosyltransferase family 2 protein [Leptospira noguchii]EQA69940.1 glycosyltransferase, group 2 family protein [Leptospira noguchii serovar Panama str. CZ214]
MNRYISKDICVLVPTKDRPHKIVNLLKSLTQQTEKVGRVIIVASGADISALVRTFESLLPVEYYYCEPAGQIRQRKMGVSKLNEKTKLVATLDDDIILESDAVEKIIKFWNQVEPETAGIGFNITNMETHRSSFWKILFYLSSKRPGVVLKSGFPTSITNVTENIKTEWLNGGATTWRQDILIANIHKKSIDAKWAPCEDLIFSYPIGKMNPMYVCAESKVIHDDVIMSQLTFSQLWYRGEILSVWMIFFVSQYSDLSILKSSIALFAIALVNILKYFILFKFKLLGMEFGRIKGLCLALISVLKKRELSDIVS